MDLQLENGRTIGRSPKSRKYRDADNHDVVLNVHSETNDWFFAEFLRAEPGALLTTMQEADEDDLYQLNQYTAPAGDSPHRGSLYALVYDDHLLFTSKGTFTSRCLENYMTWFLQRIDEELPQDRKLVLATRTPSVDRLRASSARISFPAVGAAGVEPIEDGDAAAHPRPTSRSILSTLFATDADLRRMVEDGEVEIDVVLKFKAGRSRRTMDVGDLNHVLRNVEEVDDVAFSGPDGRVNGLGARLQGTKTIATNGSFLDATDARAKLLEQFGEWREQGHITVEGRRRGST